MYDISLWQPIRPGVYDYGGKVIVLKKSFWASGMAILLGAICLAGSLVSAGSYLSAGLMMWYLWAFSGLEAIVGLALLGIGLKNRSIRNQNNGLHPKDKLYIFDGRMGELVRYSNGIEERLASLNDVVFSVKKNTEGKSTQYDCIITWPTGHEAITYDISSTNAAAVLNDIRTRIGLPVMEF